MSLNLRNNPADLSFNLHPSLRFVMFRIFLTCLVLIATTSVVQAATANSFEPVPEKAEAAARAALEAWGYRNVKNLTRDPVGNWAAEAERAGVEIAVVLQVNGEVAEE